MLVVVGLTGLLRMKRKEVVPAAASHHKQPTILGSLDLSTFHIYTSNLIFRTTLSLDPALEQCDSLDHFIVLYPVLSRLYQAITSTSIIHHRLSATIELSISSWHQLFRQDHLQASMVLRSCQRPLSNLTRAIALPPSRHVLHRLAFDKVTLFFRIAS